jgi:ABC-2 type transport system permease protein
MNGLIKAEFRKLLSTQVWFWLLLACAGLSALIVILSITNGTDFSSSSRVRDVFTAGATAYVPAFVLGMLGVTTEFRYQTITPTLLTTPSRWRLISAKLIAYSLVGAIYAAVCVATTVAIAVPWLKAKHVDLSFGGDNLWTAMLGTFVVVVLYGLIGLGFGALVKNQMVAVSIGTIWVLLAERLVFQIPYVRDARLFMPSGGFDAIFTPHDEYADGHHLLGAVPGGLVLLAWGVGLALIGAAFSMNRDIT